MLELWNYYRSGTSHRVRIGLNLKGLDWISRPLNLLKQEHKGAEFLRLNPQGLAPALIVDGQVLTQSPAILEYVEERWPEPPLLPKGLEDRARVRAMAMLIGCDIHPLNNLRVIQTVQKLTDGKEAVLPWIHQWTDQGFQALETLLAGDDKRKAGVCFGNKPTMVECYLIPQVYAAHRFEVDLAPYPIIREIDAYCATLPAFQAAHPDVQPDTPK